jgi:hypothetical protein
VRENLGKELRFHIIGDIDTHNSKYLKINSLSSTGSINSDYLYDVGKLYIDGKHSNTSCMNYLSFLNIDALRVSAPCTLSRSDEIEIDVFLVSLGYNF